MNVWEEILARVETKVNRHSFYTWFKPTSFQTEEGSTVAVRVPNSLFKDWLTKHYTGVISESLAELGLSSRKIEFVADTQLEGTEI